MRGSAPTAECLAQWGTPEPTDGAAPPTTPAPEKKLHLLDPSFATALAFAALAFYA
jgi:hypothetical protein